MLWVYGQYKYFISYCTGTIFIHSESDVYRRQILMYKDGPRAVRAKQLTNLKTMSISIILASRLRSHSHKKIEMLDMIFFWNFY